MQVTVYHNLSTDWLRGYSAGQPLVRVFEYQADDGHRELDRAFEAFNVGDDPEFPCTADVRDLAKRYRARRLRSLSVGDVVALDGVAYSCDSAGWSAVDGALTVLDGAAAEAEIRARYQMRPNEPLTVTVPLAAETPRATGPGADQAHTCDEGPLCPQMAEFLEAMSTQAAMYDDPISRAYGVYPELPEPDAEPCDHWTCKGLVHGYCDQCQYEAMAEAYR